MKNLMYMTGALAVGALMPVAIWVAAISALFQSRKRRKVSEALPHMA